MDGSFACPECGCELVLKGLSPGRQVRCGWCETWVEVPYLPRAGPKPRPRRGRSQRPGWVVWTWVGVGVVALLVAVVGTTQVRKNRSRARVEQTLERLSASVAEIEEAGEYDRARAEIETTLARAGPLGPEYRERVEAFRRRRDKLARRAVEIRLAAIAKEPAAQAVADALALRAMVRKDPVLEDFAEAVEEQLDRVRRESAEADAAGARRAFEAGRANDALDLCERLARNSEELPAAVRDQFLGEAEALVTAIVTERGLVVDPVQGTFVLGSPRAYSTALDPMLANAFRGRGYAVRRPSSPWDRLWAERAPYRIDILVIERQSGTYLQSLNRLTRIEARLTLSRRQAPILAIGPVIAKTHVPLPGLTALQSSRIAVGADRSQAAERLLYDDARTDLMDKLSTKLRTLPEFTPAASAG